MTALTLNRLAQRDIETVIDNVVDNKLIPASLRQDIIERTDGIPLFVEEMTKAVLEAESEGAAQHTVASFPSPARGKRKPILNMRLQLRVSSRPNPGNSAPR